MTGKLLAALLVVLIATRLHASDLGGRFIALLLPLEPHEALAYTLSPDRQSVYAITWQVLQGNAGASAATLHVIGVSDPSKPAPGAQIPLGDFTVQDVIARGTRVFMLARSKSQGSAIPAASIVIADVGKPTPTVIARVPVTGYQLTVSEDGSCFAIGSFGGSPDQLGSYVVDPAGKVVPSPCHGLVQASPAGGPEWVEDHRGPDSIVHSRGQVLVRSTRDGHTSEHDVSVPGTSISRIRLLAAADTLVALARDESDPHAPVRLVVLNGGALAFDPARLKQADLALMREYERLRGASSDMPPPSIFDMLAARLGDAGAREALGKSGDQLKQWGLVSVLNNWGNWQSRGTEPAAAIATFQRMVEISPDRAMAWRNLGDAARASLSGALAEPERTRLTKLALDAYSTYHKLGAHEDPEVADFIAFNALNAPHEDVCHLVAEYYSRGRQHEIAGISQPVDVNGSGRKLDLTVQFGGSLVIPHVRVIGEKGEALPSEPAFGLASTENNAGAMSNIVLVPSGGAVYAVTESQGAPLALRDWSGRQICHFSARYTASIRQSKDAELCKDLLAGPLAPVAPTETLSPPRPTPVEIKGSGQDFWAQVSGGGITSLLDVDLSESGQTDHIGSFIGYRPHGDCHYAGVTLLDGDRAQDSPRNTALLKAQWDLADCRNSSAAVVSAEGRPYVEIDSGLMRNHEIPRRTLLRVTGTGVQSVCSIVERPAYSVTKN
jgi:hypothetical protein